MFANGLFQPVAVGLVSVLFVYAAVVTAITFRAFDKKMTAGAKLRRRISTHFSIRYHCSNRARAVRKPTMRT